MGLIIKEVRANPSELSLAWACVCVQVQQQRTLRCRREALIAVECHMANIWFTSNCICRGWASCRLRLDWSGGNYQMPAVSELRTTVLL